MVMKNEKIEKKYEWNDKWIWTDNNIGEEGARMISEALKINSSLTDLNLYCDAK